MNFEIKFGGGMFSIFHITLEKILSMIQIETDISNIPKYKICCSNPNHLVTNAYWFNNIFVYDTNVHYEAIPVYNVDLTFYNAYLDKEKLILLKKIVYINEIQPSILDKVNVYAKKFYISENSLGVHIRLTDMNHVHGSDYGIYTIESYIIKIDDMLQKYKNIDHLFIASDNNVSIKTIKNNYNDKIRISYIEEYTRNPVEHVTNSDFTFNRLNIESSYPIEVFTEMLVLSKCSYFIHRISDFANFAIIYSDTFKDVLCL